MTIYLTIITTVLVITQIIRLAQNSIQLKRQNTLFKKELGQLDGITQVDLDRQRETNIMLYKFLKDRMDEVSK